jgi:hypothetical protein
MKMDWYLFCFVITAFHARIAIIFQISIFVHEYICVLKVKTLMKVLKQYM